MENFTNDKVYFVPGDVVTIKHPLINKPIMLVKAKENKVIKGEDSFRGMRCIWFTTTHELQEAIFNTKDLQHVRADK